MSNTVTIAITNWNYGRFVPEAVRSILRQSRQPEDWYIVDDGSDDESIAFYGTLPMDRVILHGEQRGAAAAYQTALDRCKTDYIIFLDADDELAPDYVEKMLQTADARRVDWVYSDMEMIDERGVRIRMAEFPDKFSRAGIQKSNFIHASALIRADLARAAGGFRVCKLKDWDLWKRVADLGAEAAKCPNTILRYRQHGASQMTTGRGKL